MAEAVQWQTKANDKKDPASNVLPIAGFLHLFVPAQCSCQNIDDANDRQVHTVDPEEEAMIKALAPSSNAYPYAALLLPQTEAGNISVG